MLKLFAETFMIKRLNLCSKLCGNMTVGCLDKESDCEVTYLPTFEGWDMENLRYEHLTWSVVPHFVLRGISHWTVACTACRDF